MEAEERRSERDNQGWTAVTNGNPIGEAEFWKRFTILREMRRHLQKMDALSGDIRAETAIPEQARDLAVKALAVEFQQNTRIFYDFLLNFIGTCMQGLHRADLEFSYTLLPGGILETDSCCLFIDEYREDLPPVIGERFAAATFRKSGVVKLDAMIAFYREEETRFDRLLGGNLERCSLVVLEEYYPKKCWYITMKLPAHVLIENQVITLE